NSADRLTPLAESWGLLQTELGRQRASRHAARRAQLETLTRLVHAARLPAVAGSAPVTLADACRRPSFGVEDLREAVAAIPGAPTFDPAVLFTVHTNLRYEAYIHRAQ